MERLYYIPTSSLNYNSIVACESISPSKFYSKRKFGMKRFTDIFDGRMADMTLLADYPARFSRPLSDVEDHPMLIEVILDEEDVSTIGNGFYAINRTIYITPYNTKFIFFNEQDRLTTESLSDHGLEVKLSHLYIPQMVVQLLHDEYDFSQIIHPNISPNTDPLANEDRINRLKGMLYGYYIGAWMSSDKTEVDQLRILLNVQNVFSASISSGRNKEEELRDLSKRWEQLNPLYIELLSVTSNVENVIAVLKKHGVRLPIENLGLSLYTRCLSEPTKEGEINPAMQWIGEKIKGHLEKMARTRRTANIDAEGILTNGSDLMTIAATEDKDMVKHWFNTVLLQEDTPAIGGWSRMDLADKITDSTSSLLSNEWRNSPQRTFLNKLRHHVGNGEAFDVKWNNEALCSMSAVILHGEEWDKMLRFMQRKGMYDYRLAFAMYGALTGYASMTRDLIDTICEETPIGYFEQLYKELYGQLHGKDLKTKKSEIPFHYPIINAQVTKEIVHSQEEADTKPVENVPSSNNQRKIQAEEIVEFIKHNAEEKSKKYECYYNEIINKGLTNWDDIRALEFKRNDGWKGLIDRCRKSRKNESDEVFQQSLFDEKPSFYNDRSCWDKIKDLVPPANAEKIKGDLKWFQEELQKGKDSKYYAKVKRESNKDAIAVFCKLKDGTYGKENAKYFSQDLRDKIKERLLSLYCSND